MRSGISYCEGKGWFSPALFGKNVARFWPIPAIYAAVQFFTLPMEIFLRAEWKQNIGWTENIVFNAAGYAPVMGLLFGLLAAMALSSYLMSARSVGMLHSLPIRREGLFFTNWLTGLVFFLVPNAVMALMALAAQGVDPGASGELVLRWFALHTVIAMFFFCFGMCCAMFTGHLLALPVFYGVLNCLVIGLCALVDAAASVLLVGCSGDRLASSTVARWCTPVYHLAVNTGGWSYPDKWYDLSETLTALGYSLVLGAAFTFLALGVYRSRKLERAGDVVTVGWVRPVFRYGVAACLGLTLGTVLYMNFFSQWGPWAYVALVAVCAALGAFVGLMFLQKTLRVFSAGWRGSAAMGLVALVLLGGARLDLFGFQRWSVDPEQVEWVEVGQVNTYPYDEACYRTLLVDDPALIAQVVRFHKTLVADLPALERAQSRDGHDPLADAADDWCTSTRLQLTYHMKGDTVVRRQYSAVPLYRGELEDPASVTAQLQALVDAPQLVKKAYLGGYSQSWVPVSGWLSNTTETGRDSTLSYEEVQLLWPAILEDLEAGRLHRYVLDDEERQANCYYTDIGITFNYNSVDSDGKYDTEVTYKTLTVQATATSTLEALRELGREDQLVRRDSGEDAWEK